MSEDIKRSFALYNFGIDFYVNRLRTVEPGDIRMFAGASSFNLTDNEVNDLARSIDLISASDVKRHEKARSVVNSLNVL